MEQMARKVAGGWQVDIVKLDEALPLSRAEKGTNVKWRIRPDRFRELCGRGGAICERLAFGLGANAMVGRGWPLEAADGGLVVGDAESL